MPDLPDDTLCAYLVTAIWSSTDEAGLPLDDRFDWTHISPESRAEMDAELDVFLAKATALLAGVPNIKWAQVAHDFWLTRNHHGAGFWDTPERWGGEAIADQLTAEAQSYGERDLVVGDDGRLYQENG